MQRRGACLYLKDSHCGTLYISTMKILIYLFNVLLSTTLVSALTTKIRAETASTQHGRRPVMLDVLTSKTDVALSKSTITWMIVEGKDTCELTDYAAPQTFVKVKTAPASSVTCKFTVYINDGTNVEGDSTKITVHPGADVTDKSFSSSDVDRNLSMTTFFVVGALALLYHSD
eukprot:Protomagalhaensia_wolfi_Nauph_80__183@NODE_10_length_5655_cov_165_650285_g7_i1_p5_GENE_NODE_10_length_5655_cov_165_650285_g7_i1NODE_10_length_5655_cov_165_650285_g7_i1_p5_ORF_typecomplete_len173_score21_28_NODE_10_length_5655_cov_165_650285_g7_i116102128